MEVINNGYVPKKRNEKKQKNQELKLKNQDFGKNIEF